jgi:hypothetical protein
MSDRICANDLVTIFCITDNILNRKLVLVSNSFLSRIPVNYNFLGRFGKYPDTRYTFNPKYRISRGIRITKCPSQKSKSVKLFLCTGSKENIPL